MTIHIKMLQRNAWLRWPLVASLLLCVAANALALEVAPAHWKSDVDAMVAGDQGKPVQNGVVFVGSSSMRMWVTLKDDFPGIPVINRGFGGTVIADSTFYADRLIVPNHPKVIVFYAGDNDIFEGHTAAQVATDFKSFVARVRKDVPEVAIVFISIKPSVARWALWPTMLAANQEIARWASQQRDVKFVDIAPQMLDSQGKPRADLLLPDGLHMRPAGYAIWIAALKPVLEHYGFKSR